MNQQEFDRYLERDGWRCQHCGTTEGLVPQHRQNRGMGGSKLRDRPSNVVVLCSAMNGDIEASAASAQLALIYGWKLRAHEVPEDEPVYDHAARHWYTLDNNYGRTVAR